MLTRLLRTRSAERAVHKRSARITDAWIALLSQVIHDEPALEGLVLLQWETYTRASARGSWSYIEASETPVRASE